VCGLGDVGALLCRLNCCLGDDRNTIAPRLPPGKMVPAPISRGSLRGADGRW
jgi:hypothetical protein